MTSWVRLFSLLLTVCLLSTCQVEELFLTANPEWATLNPGETLEITTVVTGTNEPSKKAITWSVCDGDGQNCVSAGNSARGTIEPIGEDERGNSIARYTAPQSQPSPPDCVENSQGCSIIVKGQLLQFDAACFTRVTITQPLPAFPLLVSVDNAGAQGNPGEVSVEPTVSADGRFVAFSSDASLDPGDSTPRDVFIRDTCLGPTAGCSPGTVLMSVADSGTPGNAGSTRPAISGDGRFVAFESPADSLLPNDTNGTVVDIFVRDRDTDGDGLFDEPGATALVVVSVNSAGTQGNASSLNASISSDGRFVAFNSIATTLIGGDTNGSRDIFVHDRDTDADGLFDEPSAIATVRVSVASDGSQATSNSQAPSLSAYGRFVAFSSNAANLVSGDLNNAKDVFLHDRDSDENAVFDEPNGRATIRVSVASDGSEANGVSGNAAISSNGRFVLFASNATNLVPNDTNGVTDVFARDTCRGAESGCIPSTFRVSVASDGTQGNGRSSSPTDVFRDVALSADGRFAAFASDATNLVAEDTNGSRDVFLRDTCLGAGVACTPSTIRVSLGSEGTEANGGSFRLSLTADGRFVAFESGASNLVQGDANAGSDIFLTATGF